METLAYLHLALIKEMPPQVIQGEIDKRRLWRRTWQCLIPVIVALGVFGMAKQTLAETIEQGATGPEITVIQERLQQLGYFNQAPTGFFGSVTRNAVIRFQRENSLPADGVVREETLRLLFSPSARSLRLQSYGIPSRTETQRLRTEGQRFTSFGDDSVLRRGDRGEQVSRLQARLSDRGFDPGAIDGVYGGQTESAVRQFQLENNLFADGVAGRSTLTALGISSNDIGFEEEPSTPYVVVVPFQNERTLEQVRAIVGGNVTLGEARQGRYVNAGAFESRARAESRSSFLRSRGLDARVQYFR